MLKSKQRNNHVQGVHFQWIPNLSLGRELVQGSNSRKLQDLQDRMSSPFAEALAMQMNAILFHVPLTGRISCSSSRPQLSADLQAYEIDVNDLSRKLYGLHCALRSICSSQLFRINQFPVAKFPFTSASSVCTEYPNTDVQYMCGAACHQHYAWAWLVILL